MMLCTTSSQILFSLLSSFALINTVSTTPLPFDSDNLSPTYDKTTTEVSSVFPRYRYDKRLTNAQIATNIEVLEIRAAEVLIAEGNEIRAAAAALAALRASTNYYSTVVAFGASYTDNAHSRSSQYAGSLRNYWPWNMWGGRYANGPVAVEHLVDPTTVPALPAGSSPVVLQDYAYGGSEIDNNLEGSNWPATKDQVAQYLSDVESSNVKLGSGRVLHYLNSGVNPVTAIWLNAMNNGFSSSAKSAALSSVTENINSLQAQYRSLNTNQALQSFTDAVDYIMVGIPPLEIVPTFYYQANGDSNALAFLKVLSEAFNSQLASLATSFRSEIPMNGKVFHFDLAKLFYDLHSNPSNYGLNSGTINTPCYSSNLCGNVEGYMYFDSLHPTTFTHGIMAQKMIALINSGSTTS